MIASEVNVFSLSEENNYIKWLPCENSHQTSPALMENYQREGYHGNIPGALLYHLCFY